MMRALLALALLATPAAAGDKVYQCDGNSTMTSRHDGREVVIRRPGEIAISIPRGGTDNRFVWWSPYEESWGCEVAPCAIHWHTGKRPSVVEYMIDDGEVVACRP